VTVWIRSRGAVASSTIARAASFTYMTGKRVSGPTVIVKDWPLALASITKERYCAAPGVVTPGATTAG
jgi:hypothetical protein